MILSNDHQVLITHPLLKLSSFGVTKYLTEELYQVILGVDMALLGKISGHIIEGFSKDLIPGVMNNTTSNPSFLAELSKLSYGKLAFWIQ